jgi:hypothetical protein
MSSFFDEASLVMIPSGYKDQKVYSVKPLDGSGDLTFSRASSATRVASNGLIEKVRTNLQTYSQDFSNAVWVKSAGATLTHSQTDPNGGTTASRLQMPSGTSNFLAGTAITGLTNGGKYTHSIYMKSNTGSTQSVRLLDGVRGVAGGSLTASVTTSWQRFDVVITTASTSAGLQIDNNAGTFANDILIAFAQTEESDFGATDYIATTTAAVSVGPVSGLPRLDYLNSTCPRLLLEPQRTNLVTFSEQFDNAAWTKSETTISANAATSPDGYTNADKLIASTNNAAHETKQSFTGLSGSYTISCFLKADGYNYAFIRSQVNTGADRYGVIIDLTNGTTYANATGSPTGTSSSVTSYGNGWYRLSVTATTNNSLGITIGPSSGTTFGGVSLPATFAGNGTNGVLAYGCMAEAGSYASSYVNTLSTSVTRVADAASKTGISSLIGQTEGTIFWEGQISSTSGFPQLCDLNADGNKYIQIYNSLVSGTPRIGLYIQNVSLLLNLASIATISFNTNLKFALAYKNNDYAAYLNGNLVYTNTTIGVPPTSNFGIAAVEQTVETAGKKVDQALLFKTRLTNAQLAELTTL